VLLSLAKKMTNNADQEFSVDAKLKSTDGPKRGIRSTPTASVGLHPLGPLDGDRGPLPLYTVV
jgi:hypothetical protein